MLSIGRKSDLHNIFDSPETDELPEKPAGGNVLDSTTNFPAIYLEGPHCQKSECGCCTNCFYSMYKQHDYTNATKIMEKQIDYIIDNFEELVVKQQYNSKQTDLNLTFSQEDLQFSEKKPIFLTISSTGSWFSDYEFPKESRIYLLKKLIEKSKEYERDICLYIEAHATDVVKGIDEDEKKLLNELHTKCILGFESSNEFSRNVLFNKKLSEETFKKAVSILKENGIDVGAFVIGGLITYTDLENKEDMINTVKYLKDLNVFPVMMFSNIQQYTLPDLLYQNGHYSLLEPFTVLDTVEAMFELLGDKAMWMVPEPVSGPPPSIKQLILQQNQHFSPRGYM